MSQDSGLTQTIRIRPLLAADVAAVLDIQVQCYGADFVEPHAVFERRLQARCQCSWAAERDGQVLAYLAAYWSLPGAVTPLNGEFAEYEQASVLYLHDMAVSAAAAGQGVARSLVQAAMALARERGVQETALVSVQDSQAYWSRQGYWAQPLENAAQQQHLATYGANALYMVGRVGKN